MIGLDCYKKMIAFFFLLVNSENKRIVRIIHVNGNNHNNGFVVVWSSAGFFSLTELRRFVSVEKSELHRKCPLHQEELQCVHGPGSIQEKTHVLHATKYLRYIHQEFPDELPDKSF